MKGDSLTHYQSIALLFLSIIESPDIICHLIQILKDIEIQESQQYHINRMCPIIRNQIIDPSCNPNILLIEWFTFNRQQADIIRDIRVLNEPNFWELQRHNWNGELIERTMVNGYTYKLPVKPWWKPVINKSLQKIKLLNKESIEIYPLWYRKKRFPYHSVRVKFTIMYDEVPGTDDHLYERWELCM